MKTDANDIVRTEGKDALRNRMDDQTSGQRTRRHAGKSLDGAELLDQVYQYLGEFIIYPDQYARAAHTLWIAHAHLMDAWQTTPRLAFISPEPASGKTRCIMRGSVVIPEKLPAFCAVALAGLNDLPDTISSRSIVIRMQRRAPGESIRPFRRRQCAPEGERLCGRLATWAAAVINRITQPDMPAAIADRDADAWEPLLAVGDAAGGHWPDTARVTAVTLVTLSREWGAERLGVRLLSDMRTVFGDDEQLSTTVVLDKLHRLEESPWTDIRGKPLNDRGLAARLRPYGIKPRVIRIGDTTARGYRREDFLDAWARYLPSD